MTACLLTMCTDTNLVNQTLFHPGTTGKKLFRGLHDNSVTSPFYPIYIINYNLFAAFAYRMVLGRIHPVRRVEYREVPKQRKSAHLWRKRRGELDQASRVAALPSGCGASFNLSVHLYFFCSCSIYQVK